MYFGLKIFVFLTDDVCRTCIIEIYRNICTDIMVDGHVDNALVKSKYPQLIKIN